MTSLLLEWISFLCACTAHQAAGVANIFHARCVILKMSVYSLVITWEYNGNRDAQSRNEKWNYFMLSNNKFLGKCWYGRQPWIRLAMESERMVEKGINFILCLGTAYDVSSMESIGNSRSFSLTGKACLSRYFISQFKLWAIAPPQIYASLYEGLSIYFYARVSSIPSHSNLLFSLQASCDGKI